MRLRHARGAVGIFAVALACASAAAARSGDRRPPPPRHAPAIVYSDLRAEPAVVRATPPLPPRGRLDRARPGEPIRVELTSYCLKGRTRRGRYVRSGIVAADPRIFPLGRYIELFVGEEYAGRFLVDDTGSAIRGPILDVWKPTCAESIAFGRQWGTAVLVRKDAPKTAGQGLGSRD